LRAQLRLVGGYVALLVGGAAVTYGQFMAWTHVGSPWREMLLSGCTVLEYAMLARLSDWMHLARRVDETVERHRRYPLSTVRISSQAPDAAQDPLV